MEGGSGPGGDPASDQCRHLEGHGGIDHRTARLRDHRVLGPGGISPSSGIRSRRRVTAGWSRPRGTPPTGVPPARGRGVRLAPLAVEAGPAVRLPVQDHPISDLHAFHFRSNSYHLAGALVAEHARHGDGGVARDGVLVAVADARRSDPHQHLTRPRSGRGRACRPAPARRWLRAPQLVSSCLHPT